MMVLEMFDRGGPVMWPLLTASVLAVALVLDRTITMLWWLQRLQPVLDNLGPLVKSHAWAQAEQWCRRRGPFTNVALAYLQQRDQPEAVRQDIVKREGTVVVGRLEKRLRWLAALAQISTLLGLLGTFYFMIYRFRPEATSTGQIPQAEFYAAIWESFLSTMFGLIIAIPCTAAYQLFEGHVEAVARDLNVMISYLDEWRRTPAPSAAASGNGQDSKSVQEIRKVPS
jgi:biopolymer transport protein ExbB